MPGVPAPAVCLRPRTRIRPARPRRGGRIGLDLPRRPAPAAQPTGPRPVPPARILKTIASTGSCGSACELGGAPPPPLAPGPVNR